MLQEINDDDSDTQSIGGFSLQVSKPLTANIYILILNGRSDTFRLCHQCRAAHFTCTVYFATSLINHKDCGVLQLIMAVLFVGGDNGFKVNKSLLP